MSPPDPDTPTPRKPRGRPRSAVPCSSLSFACPARLAQQLKEQAARDGTTVSRTVRRLIGEFMEPRRD
jgi:hypothetical protein